jgi:hypothetical protein
VIPLSLSLNLNPVSSLSLCKGTRIVSRLNNSAIRRKRRTKTKGEKESKKEKKKKKTKSELNNYTLVFHATTAS